MIIILITRVFILFQMYHVRNHFYIIKNNFHILIYPKSVLVPKECMDFLSIFVLFIICKLKYNFPIYCTHNIVVKYLNFGIPKYNTKLLLLIYIYFYINAVTSK